MHKEATGKRLCSVHTSYGTWYRRATVHSFFFGFSMHGPDTRELRTVHW